LQSADISSSGERNFGEEDVFPYFKRNIVIGTYTLPNVNCYSRIYKAMFFVESGTIELNYSLDKLPHCYDPKMFIIDGYFIAPYCLPCEKDILTNLFNSEPFLTWKHNQVHSIPPPQHS
jgi:hypothetical protein